MGPGVPYAIAAKFALPDRVAFALVGDGAFQMNGMNELITIAKYRHRWTNPQLIILVLHNDDLNQVTWEQRAMEGDPKYEGSQELPDFPYARYAELVGLEGIRSTTRIDVGAGVGRGARVPTGRACVEAITDPEVPPLPPHITLEQAKHFMKAIIGRRPGRAADDPAELRREDRRVPARPLMATAVGRTSPSSGSTSRRTRSRPTSPSRTGRSSGTRRRSSSSRRTRAARPGSATRTPTRRRPRSSSRSSPTSFAAATRSRRARPGSGWARALRNVGRPGLGLHGAVGGRQRALGPEGAAARRCRSST